MRTRTGIRAASLLFSLTLLAEKVAGVEGSPSDGEANLASDSVRLVAALPVSYSTSRPKPASFAPELRAKARQLRERVAHVTEVALRQRDALALAGEPSRVPFAGLPVGWGEAVINSFRASVSMEWETFAEMELNLRAWWKTLAELGRLDESAGFPKVGLRLVDQAVKSWMTHEPERCLTIILDAEKTFDPEIQPSARDWWRWVSAAYDQDFTALADKLPGEAGTRLAAAARQRAENFWARADVPVETRTVAVIRFVRYFYSSMRLAEAVALVDRWEKEHPEVTENFSWLIERYFVAANGRGDQLLAVATFHRIEELASRGKVDPAGDSFKLVSQHYYRRLPDSILLYQQRARGVVETQKKQAKQSLK